MKHSSQPLTLHPESLLRIPLVIQALSDERFSVHPRAIDAGWKYCSVIPLSVAGFNPFLSKAFYAENSYLSTWLKNPNSSARDFNESDFLMREVLFLTHDYLHNWAYRAIHTLAPKVGFGVKPVTKKNFEDFVFCHLLTEAVATVGLDYWFLAAVDLNRICNVGTEVRTLTISYREENQGEYRRFNPHVEIQTPRFFETLARFYCDGVFPGFTLDDLRKSPMTLKWLRHELEYGEKQREYARSWFSFLSSDGFSAPPESLGRPIKIDQPWKKKLITELGQLLWEKIRFGKEEFNLPSFNSAKVFKNRIGKELDFRFLNLNRFDPEKAAEKILSGPNVERNFNHFFWQYISTFDYDSFDKDLIKLFPNLMEKKDFSTIQHLFRKQKRLNSGKSEPEHLFILN